MRRLLWLVAWFAFGIWSLLAWGVYGVVKLFGGLAARNADAFSQDPKTVEWLSWAFNALAGLGLAAVLLVWGLVSLAILGVPWILSRLAGRPSRPEMQTIYPPRPDQPVIEMPRHPSGRDVTSR